MGNTYCCVSLTYYCADSGVSVLLPQPNDFSAISIRIWLGLSFWQRKILLLSLLKRFAALGLLLFVTEKNTVVKLLKKRNLGGIHDHDHNRFYETHNGVSKPSQSLMNQMIVDDFLAGSWRGSYTIIIKFLLESKKKYFGTKFTLRNFCQKTFFYFFIFRNFNLC